MGEHVCLLVDVLADQRQVVRFLAAAREDVLQSIAAEAPDDLAVKRLRFRDFDGCAAGASSPEIMNPSIGAGG